MVTQKMKPRHQHTLDLLKDLRELFAREGWTQEELAQKMKVPMVTVGRWLRAEHVPTSRTTVDALEKFLAKHRPKE